MIGATARQREVLRVIREHLASHGYPPTVREIGAAMGIRSTNGVNDHLRALERKGLLCRDDITARGMRVTEKGKQTMGDASVIAVGSVWVPKTAAEGAHRAARVEVLRVIGAEHVETKSARGRTVVARVENVLAHYRPADGSEAPVLPNALRKLPVVEAVAPEPIVSAPEDMGVRVYVFRGRPCVVAAAVGRALGYADDGKKLVDRIRGEWASEFIDGKDVETLRGADLREFKALLDGSPDSGGASRTSQLTVLYESGWDLVCIKTEKPEGTRLRRRLADEVLPKVRRGEPVTPAGAPLPAPLDVRELVAATVRELVPPLVAETIKGVMAALPRPGAPAALPPAPTAEVKPLVPKGWRDSRALADFLSGKLGRDISRDRVNKAIRELQIRERGETVARSILVPKAMGSLVGDVAKWFYAPIVVDTLAEHLRPASGDLFRGEP